MADSGGYAVAAVISGRLMRDFVRVTWLDRVEGLSFALPPSVTVAGVPILLEGELGLQLPQVTLARRPDNLVTLGLSLAGSLTVAGPGIPETTNTWVLRTTVDVGLAVSVTTTPAGDEDAVTVGLDLSLASVTMLDLVSAEGPAVPQAVRDALGSPQVLATLTAGLRLVPPDVLQVSPTTIPASLRFGATQSPVINAVAIPDADAIIVAADIAGITQGVPEALVDFRRRIRPGAYIQKVDALVHFEPDDSISPYLDEIKARTRDWADVAATIDREAFERFVNEVASPALPYDQWSSEVELSNLRISFETYTPPMIGDRPRFGIVVKIDASKFFLTTTATISMGIRLRSYEDPLTFKKPHWVVEVDIVDIDETFLQAVLIAASAIVGTVSFHLVPLLLIAVPALLVSIPSIVENVEGQVKSQTNENTEKNTRSLLYRRDGPFGADWQPAQRWLSELVISELGIDAYMSYKLGPLPSPILQSMDGFMGAPAFYGLSGSLQPFVAQLPDFRGWLDRTDPTLRVEWRIDHATDGSPLKQVLYRRGRLADDDARQISFDPTALISSWDDRFILRARITRLTAPGVDELHMLKVNIGVTDVIKRDQNFVRWSRPRAFFLSPDGKEWWHLDRESVIHRTDPALRCRNVVDAAPKSGDAFEYFSQLPVPIEELDAKRRGLLCDFCFFGGPNSHELKELA